MDNESVVYIHKGALFSYKYDQNYFICREMDGARDHQVKQNNPDPE
jgi:hypothetical protein